MQERWPSKIAIVALLITIFPWSYPVYVIGKIPVCLAAAYYCTKNYKKNQEQPKPFWYFLIIAVLFNPVLPVHLYVSLIWIIVDILCAFYFYSYLKSIRSKAI